MGVAETVQLDLGREASFTERRKKAVMRSGVQGLVVHAPKDSIGFDLALAVADIFASLRLCPSDGLL